MISTHDIRSSARPERIEAMRSFAFTERQAAFLVRVLVHSGVFIERQYGAFAGIVHGQKTHDFVRKLVDRGYATAITPGALHRGRLFHVQYKPLYEAIGEPDNRHRKPASLGRYVERLMLLDAVLADQNCLWLGTERDKCDYFRSTSTMTGLQDQDLPRLVFGDGENQTVRYFPDKLPIGIPRDGGSHVFVYLVTRELPTDFRTFLHRHLELLRALPEWSIRILVPKRFQKAARLYQRAVRDELAMPLTPEEAEELERLFRVRKGEATSPSPDQNFDLATTAKKYSSPRFQALRRTWKREGDPAIWSAQSYTLRHHLQTRRGRIEFVALTRQYLQLTSLVGVA